MYGGNSSRRRATWGAGLVALALVAGACGGDDSSSAPTEQTVDQALKEALSTTTTAGATPTTVAKRPTTVEEWEKLWETQRAAMLKKLKDAKAGKSADGKTATGIDGFTIDLSKCQTGWSDTEGLSDTEIKIGSVAPLSGTAAAFGGLPKGMGVMLDYYSAKGVFKDSAGKTRKVNMTIKDDGYDAARTIPLVDEMLDSEKPFILNTTGTPTTLKVYDKLNLRCMPNPFVVGGGPSWGDPVNHPWTTGLTIPYSTEALLWGSVIEQNVAKFTNQKIVVTSVVAKSDFGTAYDSSFRAWIAQSPLKDRIDYQPQVVEIAAPTVNNEMTTNASKDPDVFITMTGATQCPQIINEAAQNGMKQKTKLLFMSSVCKGASFVSAKAVGGDGAQSNGWLIVGGGQIDYNSVAEDGNAWVKLAREQSAAKGIDIKTAGEVGLGFTYGVAMMNALIVAGQLDGGLTRSNFIVALRAMDITNPGFLEGIKFNMSGNKDAYLIEGSDISTYDSAKQAWVVQGSPVDVSGKTSNCVWDPAKVACK